MHHSSPNAPKVASEQTYVVYEGETGRIVHVHEITVFEGAESPHKGREEVRAMEVAKRHGHGKPGLKVLAVKPGDFKSNIPQRVDLQTLRLLPAKD